MRAMHTACQVLFKALEIPQTTKGGATPSLQKPPALGVWRQMCIKESHEQNCY